MGVKTLKVTIFLFKCKIMFLSVSNSFFQYESGPCNMEIWESNKAQEVKYGHLGQYYTHFKGPSCPRGRFDGRKKIALKGDKGDKTDQ